VIYCWRKKPDRRTTMENLIIRNERPEDCRIVEELTREAFWNLHVPGCHEHYLLHVLRHHEDFIPELDLVAEIDGEIVGNIVYTKAKLVDDQGEEKEILTFGPISVLPAYQRKGIRKALLRHSFEKAVSMGYDAVVIFGHPCNYISSGFKSCIKHNVCIGDGLFPTAMLVKELVPGCLDGRRWRYVESPAFDIDHREAEEYDRQFAPREKAYQPSQEEFYIYSHSAIRK